VREFALLSDGREVTLLDDRGWTTSAPLGRTADRQEARMSVTDVVRNVYNVVLPDNAEETGEEHEWQRFAQRLREAGVAVTRDELQALPYRVILSDRLRSRLGQPS
jgi:zona occludens toxin (predicted ATPase)